MARGWHDPLDARRLGHPFGAPPHLRPVHPRSAAPILLWLLALPLITGVLGVVVFAVSAAAVLAAVSVATATPMLLLGTVLLVGVRRRRRRTLRRRAAADTAPLPAAMTRPGVWVSARDRFTALRAEYAAHECDPMAVLRLPALSDVRVSSTARFVDAFAEAQALETDVPPPGPHATAFVAAVDRAERAWRAARDAAERIRLSGLSAQERGTVERVIKLLTTARDSDSDPERLAAYARARSELARLERAGVVHLPRTAQAALDAAARGALPA